MAIDRTPLLAFTFEHGSLYLTLQVFDGKNNRVLWVEKNELRYNPLHWDIRFEGRTLRIKEEINRPLIEIVFSPPNCVEVRKGYFNLNGLEFVVLPDGICSSNTNATISKINITGFFDVAISAGELSDSAVRTVINFRAENRGHPNREAAERRLMELARAQVIRTEGMVLPTQTLHPG